MGTIWIKEFTGGLDTRRMAVTTEPGLLIVAQDGHITRGREFEKRAAFVKTYDLPPNATKSLAHTNTGVVVFGHIPAPVLPTGVDYQRLQHPDGVTPLLRVLHYELFSGLIYAIAEFTDGSIHHYYNGTRVTSWATLGYTPGTFALTFGGKLYVVAGPLVHFSKLADPTDFDPISTGAGFIDLSEESAGAEDVLAIAEYQGNLAFFAERSTQIWSMDPDPTKNRKLQTLNNTGTIAPRSVTQFGDNDIFYLANSGLRSLRARDASNAAATTDIGVAIDTLVVDDLQGLTQSQIEQITGLIEPDTGRFWLSIADRIYVFSYFSGAKVSSWSTYNPGFLVEDMVPFDGKVYLRTADSIYVYGGLADELAYDTTEAAAWLPFLDASKPTEKKKWTGVDVACEGEWEVRVAMEPTNFDASDKVATIDGTTYNLGKIGGVGESSHLSLRLTSKGDGAARVGAAVLHYEGDDGDDD